MNTIVSAANFVPPKIREFLTPGRGRRQSACVKARPEDFRVEEQPSRDLCCTIGRGTDLSEVLRRQDGEYVGVTLVKRELTTYDAVARLAADLGVPMSQITFAGLKDTWAVTAQRLVISGLPMEKVAAHCRFKPLSGAGWFIKDPTKSKQLLQKAMLFANHFTIRVRADGASKHQLEAYLKPYLTKLAQGGMRIPNAYDRQRLGRRQDTFAVGQLLISQGLEPAIKRFLLHDSSHESAEATALRQLLAAAWQQAEDNARRQHTGIGEQTELFQRMLDILEGRNSLNKSYSDFNMTVEHRLVSEIAAKGDLELAVRFDPRMCELWVGAYQAYWFNQVLDKLLKGELRIKPSEHGEIEIPLFQDDPSSVEFYRQACPAALLERIDPLVSELFLKPQQPGVCAWRPAFITVNGLNQWSEDGSWNAKFALCPGAYATNLLSMLFDLTVEEQVYA